MVNKIWNDPVWSKVIAGIITACVIAVLVYFWNWIKNISFTIFNIRIAFIFIVILILLIIFMIYRKTHRQKIIDEGNKAHKVVNAAKLIEGTVKANISTTQLPQMTTIHDTPTVFFHDRMCDAFPGANGLRWINSPKEAIARLLILLKDPTHFDKSSGLGLSPHPIWWFRGILNYHITEFVRLNRNHCLMDICELNVSKIAFHKEPAYWQDFVYIETNPDKQTGLYKYTKEDISRHVTQFGYSCEEYAIFNKRLITRAEYDDNAIVIKGKSIKTHGAELRIRYLSKYNFILCSVFSPYNSHENDQQLEQYMNNLLRGQVNYRDLFSWLLQLPRNPNDI